MSFNYNLQRVELFRETARLKLPRPRPTIEVIYLTGYSVESAKSAGPAYAPILQKPMRLSDLLDAVTRCPRARGAAPISTAVRGRPRVEIGPIAGLRSSAFG
jgi:hypothetical protein